MATLRGTVLGGAGGPGKVGRSKDCASIAQGGLGTCGEGKLSNDGVSSLQPLLRGLSFEGSKWDACLRPQNLGASGPCSGMRTL